MKRNDGTTAIYVSRMKNISTDLVYIDTVIRTGCRTTVFTHCRADVTQGCLKITAPIYNITLLTTCGPLSSGVYKYGQRAKLCVMCLSLFFCKGLAVYVFGFGVMFLGLAYDFLVVFLPCCI